MVQDLEEHAGMTNYLISSIKLVFKPSKADPVIWMKSSKDDNQYEYIAVYVDDLAICMKDSKVFCDRFPAIPLQQDCPFCCPGTIHCPSHCILVPLRNCMSIILVAVYHVHQLNHSLLNSEPLISVLWSCCIPTLGPLS